MAVAYKLLDQTDAIDAVMRRVMKGNTVPHAAAEVYRLGLTPEAIATFAIAGLGAATHARLGDVRAVATSEPVADTTPEIDASRGPALAGRNLPKPIHHAKVYWEQALSRPYLGVDERVKPLLEFTLSDARALLDRAEGQVAGWGKVRESMRLTTRLMEQHKVDRLDLLPESEKAAIAEALR